MINLRSIDLNLLVAFEALMRERNVTRAADRIGLAQPSMSNALARLRAVFDDELFVVTTRQMRPTPRAVDVAGPISEALRQIRLAIDPDRPFNPATATRCFNVAGTNQANVTLLLPIIDMLQREAPSVKLFVRGLTRPQTIRALDDGDVDLAMGVMPELPRSIAVRALFSDRAVCLARRDHAALKNGLTLKTFVSCPHVRAALTMDPVEDVDVALAYKGLERRFAMIVPSHLAVCVIVADSAMLGVVPEQLAQPVAARMGIAIHEIPLDVAPWNLCVMWNKRSEKDPAICWLRDRVHATLSGSRRAAATGQASPQRRTARDKRPAGAV